MNKPKNVLIDTTGPDDTKELARDIGQKLKGGEMIELVGDVGSGKTTFVKGLSEGADSKDPVTSPTFTLQQRYKGRVDICHYDFYRLEESGVLSHELHESTDNEDIVVVIEWAGTVEDILPKDRIRIEFIPTGVNSRRLSITIPKSKEHLA